MCENELVPFRLLPFRLLPFRLLIITWCHFAYSRFAYSHFTYLLPLNAISPTHAKCDQNNVKQLKQAVQVHKVKGIVQKNKIKIIFS